MRALLARVDSRSTGKLTVGAGAVEVSVHLLRGEVVAATAADDDRQSVRMLLSTGMLNSSQADEYDVMIESGDDVFSALLIFGRAFDEVLVGRFRQNLCDYLSSVSAPRFFEQKGVFVANIQMGHDTRRLLDELCAQCDLARQVDVDHLVVRGFGDPGPDPTSRMVANLVGNQPRTISALLHDLPLEPTRARVVIGQLLAIGAIETPGSTDLDEVEHSEELTVALPPAAPPIRPPPMVQTEPPPRMVAAPPPPPPVQLVESVVTIQPAFDEDDTLSAEVTRALDHHDDDPARSPPIHRLRREEDEKDEEEEEEDEDDARTEQVDRRTWSSMLWSTQEPPPAGLRTAENLALPKTGRTPTGGPVRGTPIPPPGRSATPAPPASRTPNPPPSRATTPSKSHAPRATSSPDRFQSPERPPNGASSPRPSPAPPQPPPRPSPSSQVPRTSSVVPPPSRDAALPAKPPEREHPSRPSDREYGSRPTEIFSRPTPPPPAPSAPPVAGAPQSLADWLNRTDVVGEEELDFFSDHEHEHRGGEADGRFRTDRANLEKIEVVGMEEEPVEEIDEIEEVEELEALEAPAVKYGAPVLSQSDAAAKIEVANEVLALVSQAFDDAEGPGRGRAVMQLLVDGVPSQYAALLHDLKVAEGGELPDDQLLRNLNARPATEHRQLLNNSLVDIIERALSSAADELPEDAFDEVFGSIAGYRQRLGL